MSGAVMNTSIVKPSIKEMNEAIPIPTVVSPEGLRVRAKLVREITGDEHCARHLELAADEIAKLRKRKKPCRDDRGDDPELAATGYQMASVIDGNTRDAKISLCQNGKVLAYLVMSAEQVYDIGAHFYKTYDELEGI